MIQRRAMSTLMVLALIVGLHGCGSHHEAPAGAGAAGSTTAGDANYRNREGAPSSETADHNAQTQTAPPQQVATEQTNKQNQDQAPANGPAPPPPAPTPASTPLEHQIIRTGQISLRIESLDSTEAAVARIAIANGGYVANSSRAQSSGTSRTGTTELRIPSAKFDASIQAVRKLGLVESETIGTSDVTQEYVDLTARLKTQQELEDRLLKLLQTRTGKLSDIVEIEEKLADVRSEIEGLQGRLRYMDNQISLSTLTITMNEPGAVGTSPETFGGRLSRAVDHGVDGLLSLVTGLITMIIALAPLAIPALFLWVMVLRPWLRRRAARKPPAPPPAK